MITVRRSFLLVAVFVVLLCMTIALYLALGQGFLSIVAAVQPVAKPSAAPHAAPALPPVADLPYMPIFNDMPVGPTTPPTTRLVTYPDGSQFAEVVVPTGKRNLPPYARVQPSNGSPAFTIVHTFPTSIKDDAPIPAGWYDPQPVLLPMVAPAPTVTSTTSPTVTSTKPTGDTVPQVTSTDMTGDTVPTVSAVTP